MPPQWTMRPEAYEFNVTAMARVADRRVASEDESDRVATFVNGELRGVGVVGRYADGNGGQTFLAPLSIYSNQETGETVSGYVIDRGARRCSCDLSG